MSIQLPSVGQDSDAYHPADAASARRIIAEEGSRHSVVVYFEKASGEARRMVARYYGHTSRKPSQIVVWDVEKGGLRTVDLTTVHTVKVCQRPAPTPQPAPDREAAPRPGQRSPKLQAMIDELADFC